MALASASVALRMRMRWLAAIAAVSAASTASASAPAKPAQLIPPAAVAVAAGNRSTADDTGPPREPACSFFGEYEGSEDASLVRLVSIPGLNSLGLSSAVFFNMWDCGLYFTPRPGFCSNSPVISGSGGTASHSSRLASSPHRLRAG